MDNISLQKIRIIEGLSGMSFAFSILASGSTGNSLYIENGDTSILVDIGIPTSKLEKAMKSIDRKITDLNGVFISHEHSDHIRGIQTFINRYPVPIYANENTWKALINSGISVPDERKVIFPSDSSLFMNEIEITSFAVSHDAIEPMFFHFKVGAKRLAHLTDTGYVSDKMKSLLRGSDVIVIESNHDVELLRMGRYPWYLKQRILGDTGHVSNQDAAYALTEMITAETKSIYLAHLSQHNNNQNLAYLTVSSILKDRNFKVDEDFWLRIADPYIPTPLTLV